MTIVQKPNKPLIVAIVGFILGKLPNDLLHKAGSTVFTVAIIVWAYGEITSGVNWFRRVLGVIVLATTFYSLFRQLH